MRFLRPHTCGALALMLSVACGAPESDSSATVAEASPAVTPSLASTVTDADDHAALVIAREAVWRAYFSGDSAALVQLLPEKMVHMGHHRDQIIRDAQEFKRSGGVYRGITFSGDEFFVRGEVAVVFSKFRVDIERNGKPDPFSGQAIELFERKDGRWINPSWHLDNDTK